MNTVHYDVVVVGASLGGVAAALAASDNPSCSVCLIEATSWLGGQFSAQGVTKPDENQYIETVGSTAGYRRFRHSVRQFYRDNFRLSQEGTKQPSLNPGGPYPGFSGSPRVVHGVLWNSLTQGRANVHVRLDTRVVSAVATNGLVESVLARASDGVETIYTAKYFLDATDLGDLLPIAGVEFRLGAESAAEFSEPAAPPEAHRDWIQPISMVVALERRPSQESHIIDRPANYDQLKASQHYTLSDGYISTMFVSGKDLWTYRRYIAAANFSDPSVPYDLSMLNMGSNDYQGGTLPTATPEGDAAVISAAREASLGYVYWLQTEVPRDDGSGNGYPNLRVKVDEFATSDGTSAQPYIRESRRIKARYTIVQQDLDQALIAGPRGKNYRDSCGIGYYGGLDIHALAAVGMSQHFIKIWPFQIPLNALIPTNATNLLPACKNIGVTHITNGAYRLHPVEWNIGEVAGSLAAYGVATGQLPSDIAADGNRVRAFQHVLLNRGIPLFWWSDVTFDDPKLFVAVHLLGVYGLASGYADMSFRPNLSLTDEDKRNFEGAAGKALVWPTAPMTRGQAALWLVGELDL